MKTKNRISQNKILLENTEWKKDTLGCLNIRSEKIVATNDPRYMNLTRKEIIFSLGKPNEVYSDSGLFVYWISHDLTCDDLKSLILPDKEIDYVPAQSMQIFFNDSSKVESIYYYLH